jgi:type II secretion system protein N
VKNKAVKIIITTATVIAALVWGAWLIAVPTDAIREYAEERLRKGSLGTELVGLEKGLFLDFRIQAADVNRDGERLVSLENITASLKPLQSLTSLMAGVDFRGNLGGGGINGILKINKRIHEADLSLNDIKVEELGLFEYTGTSGSGILNAEFNMKDNAGHAKFTVLDTRFEPITYQGLKIPINLFHTLRGAVDMEGNKLTVRSISLDGEGLYARAKGTVNNGRIDIVLELMPEKEMMSSAMVSVLLRPYKVSPGHYEIPIKTSLSMLRL